MKHTTPILITAAAITAATTNAEYINEIAIPSGHTKESHVISPLPEIYIKDDELPATFSWNNGHGKGGKSCLTKNLNQHIPQYCGSCWAHASMSALADRIAIARNCEGDPINLSIQFVLNCGQDVAGSCHGGSHTGIHQFIHEKGFIPYDTCQPYLACSSNSEEGFCSKVDTSCTALNTCRTCDGFKVSGGECTALTQFPYATIKEYGVIGTNDDCKRGNCVTKIKKEIYARGPISTSINGEALMEYTGGVYTNSSIELAKHSHVISVVGWDVGEDGVEYWIGRNSWGQYWGEEGFFRIATGKNVLGMETKAAWATPGEFTVENTPCTMGGLCKQTVTPKIQEYVDPSVHYLAIH